ncbi:MAG: branched-chain amino acid aminotransferase [Flavobacteriales bacterium]|nr:MAG: branched-chain amino acid aminotransferase [Flavobacteriales bacterium]
MKISPVKKSRLDEVDFENLPFGKIFSDHMLWCEYKNGSWQEAEIRPYGKIEVSPALHTLHYGQAIFEGQKAYRMADGRVGIFRAHDNFLRLNKSAERMCIPQIPENIFMDGLRKLVELDKNWVPKDESISLYIRPFMYGSSEFIAARPSEDYVFCILTSPSGPYYAGDVKVYIEEEFVRSAAGGVGYAKAAGNYGGSFYPAKKIQEKGYTQIIWTDHKSHELIEESGTMNIAFVIDGVLRTPPLSDRILAGITRDSVLQIARSWGMSVKEEPITTYEVIDSIKNGKLTEAFGMGTAAVISPISTIGFRGNDYDIPPQGSDSFAIKVKSELAAIRSGRKEDTFGWMEIIG